MPSFEDALAAGAVSAAHVDALAAATRNLNDQLLAEFVACEADLLTDAGNQGVDVFERGCRELARHIAAQARANADADELDEQRRNSSVKQWTDKLTGMRKTLLSLDPVRDTELWTAVNAKLASLRQADGTNGTPFDQLQVEAFIATVATGGAVSRVPQVGVLIDYQTIRDGLHASSICELDNGTPVPVSTVRRLCCDANVSPIERWVSHTKRSPPDDSTFGDGNVWCLTPNVQDAPRRVLPKRRQDFGRQPSATV